MTNAEDETRRRWQSHVPALLWLIGAMFWFLDAMLSENRLLGICLGAMFVAIAAMYFELGEKARKQGR